MSLKIAYYNIQAIYYNIIINFFLVLDIFIPKYFKNTIVHYQNNSLKCINFSLFINISTDINNNYDIDLVKIVSMLYNKCYLIEPKEEQEEHEEVVEEEEYNINLNNVDKNINDLYNKYIDSNNNINIIKTINTYFNSSNDNIDLVKINSYINDNINTYTNTNININLIDIADNIGNFYNKYVNHPEYNDINLDEISNIDEDDLIDLHDEECDLLFT